MTIISTEPNAPKVDFLWLELTNRCNMQCAHCCVDSGPYSGNTDIMTTADWKRMLDESYNLGCRLVQFIGGEPTLNPDLPKLIAYAATRGYTEIQLYTNLYHLSREVVDAIVAHNVNVKTSVYGPDAKIHDAVTKHPGSFNRTIGNILGLIGNHVPVKAAVIEMAETEGAALTTIAMLEDMGVEVHGYETARKVGRANDGSGDMGELCGHCAGDTVFVGADGRISPCTMSTSWSIGSVSDGKSLTTVLDSPTSGIIRRQIGEATIGKQAVCTPKVCSPYDTCSPKHGPGPCAPTGCIPCFPKG